MRCGKCGKENEAGARFCSSCGAELFAGDPLRGRPEPVTEKGKALRQLYDHFGAERIFNDNALITTALGDLLPGDKKFRFRMRYVMDMGFGKLYGTRIAGGQAPDSDFADRAFRILTEEASLTDRAAAEFIGLFDEMIGWECRGYLRQTVTETHKVDETVQEPQEGDPLSAGTPEYKTGDQVLFGTYMQGISLMKKKTPIEWLVLEKNGTKMLLLSRYALACQPYNKMDRDTTWETCSLREWLNDTFFREAFSAEEQRKIVYGMVRNPDNPAYGSAGGNPTMDHVFLLSADEVRKCYAARACVGTEYAYAMGAGRAPNGNCQWWLRSPGYDQHNAVFVDNDGTLIDYGYYVDSNDIAVRPAMWVDLGA